MALQVSRALLKRMILNYSYRLWLKNHLQANPNVCAGVAHSSIFVSTRMSLMV